MFCASDERIVLGSKENLNENMANFSLKVKENEFILFIRHFVVRLQCEYYTLVSYCLQISIILSGRTFDTCMYVCTYVTKPNESLVLDCAGKVFAPILLSSFGFGVKNKSKYFCQY